MKIFIERSENDQYRVGSWVYITRTRNSTCPYYNLKRYLSLAKVTGDDYIFRASTRKRTGVVLRKGNKPLSYTAARETVMDAIDSIGLNKKLFGLHSLRRGGATPAARICVNDRLFKKHGRWRSENAKDGYVSEDLETRLYVTRNLGI